MAVYSYADEAARKQAAKIPLNNGKVQPAPVTQVKTAVAKTAVKPAPIAPINNSATNTVNPAPTLGYGQGGEYGKTPGLGSAYSANKALISTDAGRNSEITRSQGVIAELQKALQADPNNADLQSRLAGANKYLTVNLGYKPGEVGISGSVVGTDPGYGSNEYQNEVDTQLAAYQGELDSAKLATQFGIDTNQNYLNESLDQLKGAEAVALDQAQQTQNRFGGLYSGGLGYQSGAINSSYANQRGGLARDVAGRNQQLLDQYGSQAKTIATQIQQLKSAAPGIIRDKIAEFKLKQSEQNRLQQAQDYAQSADTRDYNYQTGRDQIMDNRYDNEFNYQIGRDDVADSHWTQEFNDRVKQQGIDNAVKWAKSSSSGGGGGSAKPASLTQLLSIWKASGVAPEGIPGVTPGSHLYDAVAARKAADKVGGTSLWDKIKNIVGTVSSGVSKTSGSSNTVSDDDISEFVNKKK